MLGGEVSIIWGLTRNPGTLLVWANVAQRLHRLPEVLALPTLILKLA